jgi:hypothetical protein
VQQREQTLAIQANAIASMRREHAHSEEHLRVESARQMAQLQAYHSGLQKEAEAKLAVEQVSLSQLREISQRTNGMAAAEVLAQEAVFGALLATIRPSIRPPGDGGLLGRTKLSDGLFERLQRFLGASVCLVSCCNAQHSYLFVSFTASCSNIGSPPRLCLFLRCPVPAAATRTAAVPRHSRWFQGRRPMDTMRSERPDAHNRQGSPLSTAGCSAWEASADWLGLFGTHRSVAVFL